VIACAGAILGAFSTAHDARRFDAQWSEAYPGRVSPRILAEVHEYATSHETRAACLTVLAGRYRDVAGDELFWARPGIALSSAEPIRELLDDASTSLPQVSAEQVAAAEKTLGPKLREMKQFERYSGLLLPLGFAMVMLGMGGVFAVVWTGFTGTPPLLRLNDLALVNARGERASRLRSAARTAIGWLPMFIGFAAATLAIYGEAHQFRAALAGALACLATSLAAAIWSVCRPSRAPHDHLVGTWIVPR
jgi:hypothetical protein